MFPDLRQQSWLKTKKRLGILKKILSSTWIGPVVLRGGAIGRTDAKRAVSRRTFEVWDVFSLKVDKKSLNQTPLVCKAGVGGQ